MSDAANKLEMSIAKLIYDTVYCPGQELDYGVMPDFDEAVREEIGGYVRSVQAAQEVLKALGRPPTIISSEDKP